MKTTIKNSVKVIIAMIFTVLSSGFLSAQPGGGQKGEPQGPPPVPNAKQVTVMVSSISKELSLSDIQKANVSKLYTAHYDMLREKSLSKEKPKREEMEALKTDFEKQVNAVLTKDQQKKYIKFIRKQGSPDNQSRKR